MTGTPNTKEDIEDGSSPTGTPQAQAKPSKYKVKPQDKLSFAFGPEGSYFLVSAHEWVYFGNPGVIDALKNANFRNIATATITFLGDGLIVSCPPEKGHAVSKWQQIDRLIPVDKAKQWTESQGQLQRLCDLLQKDERENSRSDVEVTWGDGNTWWAGWNEGEWVGNELPKTLSEEIQSKEALDIRLRHVALGRLGSWVALWNDGGFSFSLNGYEKLGNELNDIEKGGIEYIALDPHTSELYFMILNGGDVSYSVYLSKAGNNDLLDQICRYQQRRAWRDMISYTMRHSRPRQMDFSIKITPDTDWVSTKANQQGSIMNRTIEFARWSSIRINEELGFRSLAPTFVVGLTAAAITTGLWRTYATRSNTHIQHKSFATMRQGARLWGRRLGFPLGVAVGGLSAFFYKR